jgi:uridine phosphorylase
MLKKNKIPLLEFDTEERAVINPGSVYNTPGGLPKFGVMCFQDETVRKLKRAGRLKTIFTLRTVCQDYPVYQFTHKGRKLLLFRPTIGAAAAAGLMEELGFKGCTKWIICGSAGGLDKAHSFGHLIVPRSAVRDEGFSYHYLKPSREVAASPRAVAAIKKTLTGHGVPFLVSKTWTTDAFFRETPGKVALRKKEGCLAVDMEAAAVFAVAKFRGYQAGAILYLHDDVSGADWDRRREHDPSYVREKIFWLAAEACLAI